MGYATDEFSSRASPRAAAPRARRVPRDSDHVENWSFAWATDTLKLEPRAFAGATFARVQPSPAHRDGGWSITFSDHAAYVDARDAIKREQLAKAGAPRKPVERHLALARALGRLCGRCTEQFRPAGARRAGSFRPCCAGSRMTESWLEENRHG